MLISPCITVSYIRINICIQLLEFWVWEERLFLGHMVYVGHMGQEGKLDLSKLCEFCIKSCAERRKMTEVN